ncbi:LuxR family transcriptional regulator [Cupriavidus necator]|uniref:LuxR family transcriptional regulator n=2 Tax=Cupriavidus necator TaxID=106590 RepID=A0A1U9V1Y9_CUPNE|nr:LuxR family transcriptional regulator [Cupriavidus necator]
MPTNATLSDSRRTVQRGQLLLVGHEGAMCARLCGILSVLGYGAGALAFAGTIEEACVRLGQGSFDMALVDTGLPDGSGIELIRRLRERTADLPVVVVSSPGTDAEIVGALIAGATGYLLSERDDIELTVSLRGALRGGTPIDPAIAKRLLTALVPKTAPAETKRSSAGSAKPLLSARETEILVFINKGSTNREIADALSLSRLTIESHVKNIYKKLAVKTRTQAIFEARAYGVLN